MENEVLIIPITDIENENNAILIDKHIDAVSDIISHKTEVNNRRVLIKTQKTESLLQVIDKIRGLGFTIPIVKKTFPVQGMTCASCASSVESILGYQKGILSASVNLSDNSVAVAYLPENNDVHDFQQALKQVGYDLIVADSDAEMEIVEAARNEALENQKKNLIWASVFEIPLFIIGMFFMHSRVASFIMWALATPVLFIWGKQFFVNAWKKIRHGSVNMDTLVALSTGIAYVFSVFNTLFQNLI